MNLTPRALLATTAIAASALTPTILPASDLGYTYAEARYLDVDLDGSGGAEGATAIGWYRFSEHLFAIGQVIMTDADSGAEATTFAAGGGFIQPLNDQWDVVAIATLRRTEVDTGFGDLEKNGYGAQLGLRGMPVPKIETRAFLNYVDLRNEDTSIFLSGDYFFSPVLAAGIAAEFGERSSTFSIGVRYAFGN
jgi:hypothetical protein